MLRIARLVKYHFGKAIDPSTSPAIGKPYYGFNHLEAKGSSHGEQVLRPKSVRGARLLCLICIASRFCVLAQLRLR